MSVVNMTLDVVRRIRVLMLSLESACSIQQGPPYLLCWRAKKLTNQPLGLVVVMSWSLQGNNRFDVGWDGQGLAL